MMNIDSESTLHLTPSSFLSRRVAVLGTTGSGKSNTVAVLLEELLAHLPFAVIDPHGEYFTLRERFDVLIVGRSDNADQQISADQAGAVALWSYQNRKSVILDLYKIVDEDERLAYVFNFCNAIWEYGRTIALGGHQPYGVVLEEAHNFIPESLSKNPQIKILKTFANEGRKFGFLMIASTQRASKISKDYLAACDYRFFQRVSDAPDVKAYAERLSYTAKQVKQVAMELATGQAIFRTASSQQIIQVRQRFTRHIQANMTLDENDRPALRPIDDALLAELRTLLSPRIPPVTASEQTSKSVPEAEADSQGVGGDHEAEIRQLRADLEAAHAQLRQVAAEVEHWKTVAAERDIALTQAETEIEELQERLRQIGPVQLPLLKDVGAAPITGPAQLLPQAVPSVDTMPATAVAATAKTAQQIIQRERTTTTATTTTTVEREVIGQHISSRSLSILQKRQQGKFEGLIRALCTETPQARRVLLYFIDLGSSQAGFIHIEQAAIALDYDTDACRKSARRLLKLGLLRQETGRSLRYQSGVVGYLAKEYPNLDTHMLLKQLVQIVAA